MDSIAKYNIFYDSWKNKPLPNRKRVNEFILLGTMGRGAFGTVKLSVSTLDKMFYAVKVLEKAQLRKQQRQLSFEKGNQNKMPLVEIKEIAIMKKLDHPNVVLFKGVFDDEENDLLYIVLEYMSQGSVMNSSKVQDAETMDEFRAREVFMDVLVGLEYLHANRIVHRDLKPENLLTKADGRVKISDFGAAKMYSISHEDKTGGPAAGTPAFTAPELCLSEKSPKGPTEAYPSDIWSLGVTLYYLVFGRIPFIASSQYAMYDAICTQPVEFPESPRVSKPLKDLIRHILTKNPNRRPSIDDIWGSRWVKDFLNPVQLDGEDNLLAIEKARQVQEVRRNYNNAKFSKNKLLITEADLREAVLTVKTTEESGELRDT
eukprot:Plantae.Rhodophyta-Rhodochaete_pulchella.ctg14246.p1 GENE.Plantae.Rhodophyta-Rhodochaete_pulchella.ctg14246~~Plantae.Rhodophyta-Rhodochaete_pulchella.ctg14246.p1  ORF type:complete len:420 (+),score=91.85 Plantae.Rhodophyta-Rhodochaete_pulchella.ctg14246:140-1261(+)